MPKIHASGMVTDVNVVAVSGVTQERVIAVTEAVDTARPRRKAGATSAGTDSSESSPTSKPKRGTSATAPPPPAPTMENP